MTNSMDMLYFPFSSVKRMSGKKWGNNFRFTLQVSRKPLNRNSIKEPCNQQYLSALINTSDSSSISDSGSSISDSAMFQYTFTIETKIQMAVQGGSFITFSSSKSRNTEHDPW